MLLMCIRMKWISFLVKIQALVYLKTLIYNTCTTFYLFCRVLTKKPVIYFIVIVVLLK